MAVNYPSYENLQKADFKISYKFDQITLRSTSSKRKPKSQATQQINQEAQEEPKGNLSKTKKPSKD